ncbi:MAG TPA: hypothetical protein VFS84_14575, partial [Candidatus Binatia bacterium]|nr:hypothetical protein [Candidatus Binatia bacterium]
SAMNADKASPAGTLDGPGSLQMNSSRPPLSSELRTGTTVREDYDYNRTDNCLGMSKLGPGER